MAASAAIRGLACDGSPGLCSVGGEGLLAQHVLARLERRLRQLAVQGGGQRHVDGVQLGVGQQLLVAARHARDAAAEGEAAAAAVVRWLKAGRGACWWVQRAAHPCFLAYSAALAGSRAATEAMTTSARRLAGQISAYSATCGAGQVQLRLRHAGRGARPMAEAAPCPFDLDEIAVSTERRQLPWQRPRCRCARGAPPWPSPRRSPRSPRSARADRAAPGRTGASWVLENLSEAAPARWCVAGPRAAGGVRVVQGWGTYNLLQPSAQRAFSVGAASLFSLKPGWQSKQAPIGSSRDQRLLAISARWSSSRIGLPERQPSPVLPVLARCRRDPSSASHPPPARSTHRQQPAPAAGALAHLRHHRVAAAAAAGGGAPGAARAAAESRWTSTRWASTPGPCGTRSRAATVSGPLPDRSPVAPRRSTLPDRRPGRSASARGLCGRAARLPARHRSARPSPARRRRRARRPLQPQRRPGVPGGQQQRARQPGAAAARRRAAAAVRRRGGQVRGGLHRSGGAVPQRREPAGVRALLRRQRLAGAGLLLLLQVGGAAALVPGPRACGEVPPSSAHRRCAAAAGAWTTCG
jgi:hypothetical protein